MLRTKPKPCKICGSNYHQAFTCPANRKPLNAKGKQAAKWYKTKVQWMQANENTHYTCHYCGRYLPKNETTLDHLEARSRRPDLRNELTNLVPCCWNCNSLKGSVSHDEYVHECH